MASIRFVSPVSEFRSYWKRLISLEYLKVGCNIESLFVNYDYRIEITSHVNKGRINVKHINDFGINY
jgi:hypothetical protein